jgi:beta-mannanase
MCKDSFDEVIDLLENNLELIYEAHPEYVSVYLTLKHIKDKGKVWFGLKAKNINQYKALWTVSILSHSNIRKFADALHAYIQVCKAEVNLNKVLEE